MTAHPCIIQQRAASTEAAEAIFEIIFAKRLEFLADHVAPHHPAIAELALSWANEHRIMAATLRGERQIGDDDPQEDEAMRIAIDFGGPLPVRSAAE